VVEMLAIRDPDLAGRLADHRAKWATA
jgi:hypothetical protein